LKGNWKKSKQRNNSDQIPIFLTMKSGEYLAGGRQEY